MRFSLVILMFLLSTSAGHAGTPSPMNCQVVSDGTGMGDAIQCKVIDSSDVTFISINEGNCVLPQIPDESRDQVLEAAKEYQSHQQPGETAQITIGVAQLLLQIRQSNPSPAKVDEFVSGLTSQLNDPQKRGGVAAALVKMYPVGEYRSGDSFIILAEGCDVLKWEIATRDGSWTWRR